MKKSELIQKLAKRFPHLYQRDVELLVNTVLGEISGALVDGRRVELRGFGAFSIRERDARKARNPKTGKEVQIGKRAAIYFRTGKELHERIAVATGHVDKLGLNLGRAVKSYNDFVGSFETRIVSSARKFKELGADSPKELPADPAPQIEIVPREVKQPASTD